MSKLTKVRIISVRYIRKLVEKFFADGSIMLSSSTAYYFLFSIFPLMLILISISGFLVDSLNLSVPILEFVEERVPIIYSFTEVNLQKAVEHRRSIGITGVFFLLLSTTYVFDSIQFALNKIFKTKSHRKFWKQKAFGFLIISMVFGLIFFSFLFSTLIFYLADIILAFLAISETVSNVLIQILSILIGLLFNFAIFNMIYFFGTNRRVTFKNIYIGALVAAASWEISKHVFIIFLNQFAAFELTYGSVGSIIGFLLWVYISSIILLLGAQINSLTLK